MENLIYVSAGIESAIILACIIFVVLLLTTRLLPKKENTYGILLFLNLAFLSGFYFLINVGWSDIAQPIVWIFLPATTSVSFFFYRFNTSWLQQKFLIDRFLLAVPTLVLVFAALIELSHFLKPDSVILLMLRIDFTIITMKYIFPAFGALIIALNFFKVRMEEQSNKEAYADRMVVNLSWCYASLVFYTLFFAGVILSEIVNPWVSELLFNLSLLALTLYLGYYQIKIVAQYLKSTRLAIATPQNESVIDDQPMVQKSSENVEDLEKSNALFQRLDALVNEDLLYLKSDLTIHQLGVQLEMNSKYLSQAINQQGDLNFNKYINQKRIEHAKTLLFDPAYSNYSLEGIGNESGFRSKSTFNTTFKSITGMTPSEYRKSRG